MTRHPVVRTLLPAACVFLVLRLPSFIEPRWYTDEAGYLTTARALIRGKVLYSGIWTNKPPLHVWTLAAVTAVLGSSEWALHLLTFVSGLTALAAIAYAASRLLSMRRALVAVLLAAALLGTPVFDAQLAIPESLLIAPVTWAGALLVVGVHEDGANGSLLWPVAVGALAAAGVCYQQTALAETAAFALVMVVSSQVTRAQLLAYLLTFVTVSAVWLTAAVAVAGLRNVVFALVGFYVPYTQSALPTETVGSVVHAGGILLALVLLLVALLRLGRRPGTWMFWVWAAAALLVPAATHLPYPHFLAPAVAPVALGIASLDVAWLPRLSRLRLRLGSASLAGAVIIAAALASHAGMDFVPPAAGAPWANGYRTLSTYYGGAFEVAARKSTLDDWHNRFDDRVSADSEVSDWLKQHGFDQARVVVWSSDAWPYVLGDFDVELPTGPIYNNFVILGAEGQVSQRVQELNPDVIITSDAELAEYGEIQPVLNGGYKRAYTSSPDIVWLRSDVYSAMLAAQS